MIPSYSTNSLLSCFFPLNARTVHSKQKFNYRSFYAIPFFLVARLNIENNSILVTKSSANWIIQKKSSLFLGGALLWFIMQKLKIIVTFFS